MEPVCDGEELWNRLISWHPNIVLTRKGHTLGDGLGRTVTPTAGRCRRCWSTSRYGPTGGRLAAGVPRRRPHRRGRRLLTHPKPAQRVAAEPLHDDAGAREGLTSLREDCPTGEQAAIAAAIVTVNSEVGPLGIHFHRDLAATAVVTHSRHRPADRSRDPVEKNRPRNTNCKLRLTSSAWTSVSSVYENWLKPQRRQIGRLRLEDTNTLAIKRYI
jgi:hypothetical protein